MKKKKVSCIIIFVLCVLAGFAVYLKFSVKMPEVFLSEECKNMEIEMACKIAEDIQNIISSSKKGIYKIDNFLFFFDKEEIDNEDRVFYIKVTADWTMVREPENDPVIKGMYQVYNEIQNEKEKQEAKDIINGFLVEIQSEYMLIETLTYEVIAVVSGSGNEGYKLYYPLVRDQEETLIPLNEYFTVEDSNAKMELGKNTILEIMELK